MFLAIGQLYMLVGTALGDRQEERVDIEVAKSQQDRFAAVC
jgi:hypothetical protein